MFGDPDRTKTQSESAAPCKLMVLDMGIPPGQSPRANQQHPVNSFRYGDPARTKANMECPPEPSPRAYQQHLANSWF